MKRVSVLLLAVVMLLSVALSGCSMLGENPLQKTPTKATTAPTENVKVPTKATTAPKEEEKAKPDEMILGKWEAKLDMLPLLEEGADEADEDLIEYLDLKNSYKVTFTLEFDDDGEFEATIDEKELQAVFEDYIDAVADATVLYLKDMIREEGLTVAEFEDEVGMSIEKYVKEEMDSLEIDDFMPEDLETSGDYKIKGTKLTIDDTDYTVELEENSLTFTDCEENDDEFFVLAEDVKFKKK